MADENTSATSESCWERFQFKCVRFLNQRNDFGHHRNSALRSIDSNMFYLFTYADVKNSNIPPTNNHLEGVFGQNKNTPRFG